ncbi:MAG: hypothetical protein JJT78_13855 [Leptospira sp.]|nr:hypothetical protein [Leptospira sp.]
MNIPLIIANILTILAFAVHTFMGDKELRIIEPKDESDTDFLKREKWTMARCGWHWISFDLLFVSLILFLINFTDFFDSKNTILQILSLYFLGYSIFWLFTIFISKDFPKKYFKLGQWILLLGISIFIFLGIK